MVNNYIRIGYSPNLVILTFDDRDPTQVQDVKARVQELIGGRIYGTRIGQWKRCTGLSYPIIGDPVWN